MRITRLPVVSEGSYEPLKKHPARIFLLLKEVHFSGADRWQKLKDDIKAGVTGLYVLVPQGFQVYSVDRELTAHSEAHVPCIKNQTSRDYDGIGYLPRPLPHNVLALRLFAKDALELMELELLIVEFFEFIKVQPRSSLFQVDDIARDRFPLVGENHHQYLLDWALEKEDWYERDNPRGSLTFRPYRLRVALSEVYVDFEEPSEDSGLASAHDISGDHQAMPKRAGGVRREARDLIMKAFEDLSEASAKVNVSLDSEKMLGTKKQFAAFFHAWSKANGHTRFSDKAPETIEGYIKLKGKGELGEAALLSWRPNAVENQLYRDVFPEYEKEMDAYLIKEKDEKRQRKAAKDKA